MNVAQGRLILIDGMPGSGKSSLAKALGERIPEAKVYFENWGVNPLHAVPVEGDVAEFAAIYDLTPEQFSELSLHTWRHFVQTARAGIHIAESYPFQSAVRLLLQMDADLDLIRTYYRAVEQAVAPIDTRLVFLRMADAVRDVGAVSELRGPAWFGAVKGFISRTTWARNRKLNDDAAPWAFIAAYDSLVSELLDSSTLRRLELRGGKDFGPDTVDRAYAMSTS